MALQKSPFINLNAFNSIYQELKGQMNERVYKTSINPDEQLGGPNNSAPNVESPYSAAFITSINAPNASEGILPIGGGTFDTTYEGNSNGALYNLNDGNSRLRANWGIDKNGTIISNYSAASGFKLTSTGNIYAQNIRLHDTLTTDKIAPSTDGSRVIIKGPHGLEIRSTSTKALAVAGGADISGTLEVGNIKAMGDIEAAQDLTIEKDLVVKGTTTTQSIYTKDQDIYLGSGNLHSSGTIGTVRQTKFVGSSLDIDGKCSVVTLSLSSQENSTSNSTGALTIPVGGLGVGKDIYCGGNINSNDTITAQVAIGVSSSKKVKENIHPTNINGLDIINSVDVVEFNYIADKDKVNKIGFIAEDTNPLMSGPNQDRMELSCCIGILMKAVQELSQKIADLESQLKS